MFSLRFWHTGIYDGFQVKAIARFEKKGQVPPLFFNREEKEGRDFILFSKGGKDRPSQE